MKKLVAITLVAIVFNILSPIMSSVHAASLEDIMNQAIAKNSNLTSVQELLKLKQELDKGDKAALLGAVNKVALDRMGSNNSIVNTLTSDNIRQVVETTARQEAEKCIGERLAPYQKEMSIIASLLNSSNALNPQSALDNNSLIGAPANYKQVLDMTSTAYAPGALDNGKWKDQTYMGGTIRKGVVAVDPKVIPMGTKLWVEGYGDAIAVDQGSAIKGNRIDLAFNDRQEALDYGIQKAKVYVLN